jgi:hypothetical protein
MLKVAIPHVKVNRIARRGAVSPQLPGLKTNRIQVSDAQKSAVKVTPEILAKYIGVYKGLYLQKPRTVEVTFSGGTLFAAVNGGPKQPIVPQSETNFSGTGLTYRFIRDDRGIATDVVEGHVSGDYKFQRQK